MTLSRRVLSVLIALGMLGSGACDRADTVVPGSGTVSTPFVPTGPSPAGSQEPAPDPLAFSSFEVSGIVTDESGRPVPAIGILMTYDSGGRFPDQPRSTQTDASGAYTIQFMSRPYINMVTGAAMAARAEIITPGFEWYQRYLPATGPRLTENFRLRRPIVVAAGDSVAVDLSPENGGCLGWMYPPCGRARVIIPADGTLTLAAMIGDAPAPGVVLEAFGGDAWGNPLTIAVPKAPEFFVDLGHSRDAMGTSERIRLKTSFTAN